MHFIDECDLVVEAGDGGDGAIAFRRERYEPMGGPSGGDGGRGGDVIFIADSGGTTLYDLKHLRIVRAGRGENGQGKDMYGRGAKDAEVRVPLGTVVSDAETGEVLFELVAPGESKIAAKGGGGGRGNIHFATSTERAPRRAERGRPGDKLKLHLELKVVADVGLVGFPNVGKSTFIAAVSRARPRIADYPFTTLTPNLGVVRVPGMDPGMGSSFVVADVPGLIVGASQGAGLGTRFLRHLERTRVLLHLLAVDPTPGRSPLDDYRALRLEIETYDPDLAKKREIVAFNKADLPDVRAAYDESLPEFRKLGIEPRLVSAATHEGLDSLIQELSVMLRAAE